MQLSSFLYQCCYDTMLVPFQCHLTFCLCNVNFQLPYEEMSCERMYGKNLCGSDQSLIDTHDSGS